jgi:hypothetical protein
MQLKNLLSYKKNTGVCVNGHVYQIAQDLVIRDEKGEAVDVPQADATKLLLNTDAWRQVGAAEVKKDRAAAKAGLQVVLADGSVVPPAPKAETHPTLAGEAPVSAQTVAEAPKAAGPVETKPQTDPPIPEKGEDWADPSTDYSLEWLQACAKAYKCHIPKNKSNDKALLVEKIDAAMYEEK